MAQEHPDLLRIYYEAAAFQDAISLTDKSIDVGGWLSTQTHALINLSRGNNVYLDGNINIGFYTETLDGDVIVTLHTGELTGRDRERCRAIIATIRENLEARPAAPAPDDDLKDIESILRRPDPDERFGALRKDTGVWGTQSNDARYGDWDEPPYYEEDKGPQLLSLPAIEYFIDHIPAGYRVDSIPGTWSSLRRWSVLNGQEEVAVIAYAPPSEFEEFVDTTYTDGQAGQQAMRDLQEPVEEANRQALRQTQTRGTRAADEDIQGQLRKPATPPRGPQLNSGPYARETIDYFRNHLPRGYRMPRRGTTQGTLESWKVHQGNEIVATIVYNTELGLVETIYNGEQNKIDETQRNFARVIAEANAQAGRDTQVRNRVATSGEEPLTGSEVAVISGVIAGILAAGTGYIEHRRNIRAERQAQMQAEPGEEPKPDNKRVSLVTVTSVTLAIASAGLIVGGLITGSRSGRERG